MKVYLILLALIISIKTEWWYPEINGHDQDNSRTGYAGFTDYPFTDFYLCSERKYRVHYLYGEWSEEFTACEPAGDGRTIDAISISGGLEYEISTLNDNVVKWYSGVTGYNISDYYNGYAGEFGKSVYMALIYGDEYYRSGLNKLDDIYSSNEKKVAVRVIKNLFDRKYNEEKEKQIFNSKTVNITVKLLNPKEIKLKGKMSMIIENREIIYSSYKNLLSDELNKFLEEAIYIDINKIRNYFEIQILTKGLLNGIVTINFNWLQNLIEIDFASKIASDYYSFRGGFRFNLDLNNDEILFSKINKIFIILFKRFGIKKTPQINELLSNLDNFKKVDEIINYLGLYSNVAEEILFFTIILPAFDLDK
jgi:hypothetical protein